MIVLQRRRIKLLTCRRCGKTNLGRAPTLVRDRGWKKAKGLGYFCRACAAVRRWNKNGSQT